MGVFTLHQSLFHTAHTLSQSKVVYYMGLHFTTISASHSGHWQGPDHMLENKKIKELTSSGQHACTQYK